MVEWEAGSRPWPATALPFPRAVCEAGAFVLGIESGEAHIAGSEAHSPLFGDKGPAGPFVWRLAEPEVCEPAFAPASLTQA